MAPPQGEGSGGSGGVPLIFKTRKTIRVVLFCTISENQYCFDTVQHRKWDTLPVLVAQVTGAKSYESVLFRWRPERFCTLLWLTLAQLSVRFKTSGARTVAGLALSLQHCVSRRQPSLFPQLGAQRFGRSRLLSSAPLAGSKAGRICQSGELCFGLAVQVLQPRWGW
eukprot:3741970-Rhodomonas_salina.1